MKRLHLAALPALFLTFLALSSTLATDPTPVTAEQTLLSYKWLFVNIRGAKYEFIFHKDGTLTCEGHPPAMWSMTGPASFQLNNAPGAAKTEQFNFSDDFSRWVSTETVKGQHRSGYIKGPLDGPSGTSPTVSGGTQPPNPGATPPPDGSPAMSPADQRNQLANFYSQIPNTAAWVHAPLNVTVPPNLYMTLAAFKQGLAVEALQANSDLRKAYGQAAVLIDALTATTVARAQYLRAQTAPGAVPSPAAVANWAVYARGYRTTFKNPRAVLDEDVRDGGGVGRATAIAGSTPLMPGLPPAPASAQSPDFDATAAYKRIYGSGPSFVNNPMLINVKLGIYVTTDSETSLNLMVDGYWIGGTRDSYQAKNIFHQWATVGWRKGFNANVPDQFRGTGHMPGAIIPGLNFPYAGWTVTIHDSAGTLIGQMSSQGIFDKYVQ